MSLAANAPLMLLFVAVSASCMAQANGNSAAGQIPLVNRTTDRINLVESRTLDWESDTSLEINFYRNEAYTCGLSGHYTFIVIEPINNPGIEAPLWTYLHGGGYGWFDKNQTYQTVKTLTQDTWNHEESFDKLINAHLIHNTHTRAGELMSSTLTRRIREGYRILLVSLCDHDNYGGWGDPYPNNPNPSAQVNGLQATMAAMDYTVANYSTSQVFAHGTSCGSLGVWSAAAAYSHEDIYLTAIVADSWTFDPPRIFELFDIYVGVDPYPFNGGDLRGDGMEKMGFDYEGLRQYPEAMIRDGFTEVPSMFIIGELDPACGGKLPTIPAADEANLSNCRWHYDRLRQAIDEQPNTPHILDFAPNGDHVETNRNNPVNTRVDNFLAAVWSTHPPHVFGPPDPTPPPPPQVFCHAVLNDSTAAITAECTKWFTGGHSLLSLDSCTAGQQGSLQGVRAEVGSLCTPTATPPPPPPPTPPPQTPPPPPPPAQGDGNDDARKEAAGGDEEDGGGGTVASHATAQLFRPPCVAFASTVAMLTAFSLIEISS